MGALRVSLVVLTILASVPALSSDAPAANSDRSGGEPGRASESSASALRIITSVEALRKLPPEEAARGYPVRLRGVVTYRAPGLPLQFLQDETGGTYVSGPISEEDLQHVQPGHFVEVEGVTTPGRFAPHLGKPDSTGATWRVLGRRPLPTARRVSIGELADPQFHSEYIELSGVVRQVRNRWLAPVAQDSVWIKIGTATSAFTAQYFDAKGVSRLPARFIGSRVTVRGVYGSTFNEQRQLVGFRLFVDPEHGIEVESLGPADPLVDLPETPIAELMQFRGETRDTPMVRIQGAVTQVVSGSGFYLESGERGIWVETEQALASLQPGHEVKVAGFPAFGSWSPILQDSLFQIVGRRQLQVPPLVSTLEARTGRYDCRRITMDAVLLDIADQGEVATGLLQHDGVTFVAEWISPDAAAVLRGVLPGSRVRVTGTCVNKRIDTSGPFEAEAFSALVTPRQVGFRLLVTSPNDVAVLRAPDWWTAGRIWTALGVVLASTGAILAWNILLRRRVSTQTEIIRSQSAREAVHEDRTRIARELHDTLEQELTGIAVQLDAVSDRLPQSPPAAASALSTARALLRHTRTEARRSVWDLRAALLEEGDLVSAFRETARQFGAGAVVTITVDGEPYRLPGSIESNLLRIGTEALTNAWKHAAARQIRLKLSFESARVRLEVSDDGQGFDASRATTLAGGHFGLLGIRERTERIGAELSIHSDAGVGTRIVVTVINDQIRMPDATASDGVVEGDAAFRSRPSNKIQS